MYVIRFRVALMFVFVVGWLLPKFSLGGVNIGIQEISSILILLTFKMQKIAQRILLWDILYSFAFATIAVGNFILFKDLEALLTGLRTLLFVAVCMNFSALSVKEIVKLKHYVLLVNYLFVTISVFRILFHFIFDGFDALNFFYGADSYRVRAPFENGGASSQVPIGYMLVFCFLMMASSEWVKKTITLSGIIATTSRAALLSVVFSVIKGMNFRKAGNLVLAFIILALLGTIVYLKSFMANDGALDGSANKRLELYISAITLMLKSPAAILTGFGVTTKALAEATGEGFYESFLFNSLMQGGVILLALSVGILIKAFYWEKKYGLSGIGIAIFLGNAIGGSNYFSMYAYPLMALWIFSSVKQQQEGI